VATVVVTDRAPGHAAAVARSLGPQAEAAAWHTSLLTGADVLLLGASLAGPPFGVASARFDLVETALEAGAAVVSVADGMTEVEGLLRLDGEARLAGLPVVVGAALAPGLSDVLARQAAAALDSVEEIHVAKIGTGGPACARQHHRALGAEALDWREGQWVQRAGGSGRELCWFPDPVGGQDCYRAGLPDALLLVPAFPGVSRVTARVAATRRDRMTSVLPMLRRPHPEGEVGAIRVEVRGHRAGARVISVLGAIDRPAIAAGAVAALSAIWAGTGRLRRAGAGGLAEMLPEPAPFLAELARRGVKTAVFEGGGRA
jgi:saccharopine dehydrogenase-like NADP-dependent oxidoreductase